MSAFFADVNSDSARGLADWLEATRPESAQDASKMDAVIGILRAAGDGATDRSRYEAVAAALQRLVVDADRLCGPTRGGHEECRASIRHARAVMASAREAVWPVGGDGCVTG